MTAFSGENGTRELIRRLRAGDESAFTEIYDRHSRMIYGMLLQSVRDPGVAEDLLQETFLKLWKAAPSLDENAASLAPWLSSVARNAAASYFRSHGKVPRLELLESAQLSGTPSVQRAAVDEERTRLVRNGLDRLDNRHLRVLQLAYFEGFTHTEMAAAMNRPLGTVKSRVRMALASLRSILAENTARS